MNVNELRKVLGWFRSDAGGQPAADDVLTYLGVNDVAWKSNPLTLPILAQNGDGGWTVWFATGIAATAVTIVPNGAGDVTAQVAFSHASRDSAGGSAAGATQQGNPSDLAFYSQGGNNFNWRVNADGSWDVRRTAGTATLTTFLMAVWT